MIEHDSPSGGNGRARFAARATLAHEAIRDNTAHLPAVVRAVLRDSDRDDVDDVEHVRQSRLRRWQAER